MTKYATMNPLGSVDPRDLFDNAQNFDSAVNNITTAIWLDRFGRTRHTWYGLEKMAKEAIAAFGYITMDSFLAGATLTLPNQVLRDTSNGEYYRWDGSFLPSGKIVPPGSTPASSGGVGVGAWLSVGDAVLRSQLAKPDGAKLIGLPGGRTQYDKNAEIISIGDFPPTGLDAYPQFQAAFDAAPGKTLHITAGVYILTGGTPVVRSNTRVLIDPGAVIRQPNKGQFDGFAIMPGSKNITIEGQGSLIGPWEGGVTPWPNGEQDNARWNSEQAENNGINIRGRWYQREILGYTLAQMQALTDVSTDIHILGNLHIEGFGQSAIIADNVTRFTCRRPFLTLCGRDGLRMYGVRRGSIHVDVDTLAPGFDGDYPNFNVYGVTCTRMYGTSAVPDPNMTIGRKSAKCVISHSTIRNCFTWKGLDTHGGEDIKFVNNDVEGCYICIGIDKGGINDINGKAIARNILVDGNTLSRGAAQYRRSAVTAFGHNTTDQMAENITITNNVIDGMGGNDIDGAVTLSNVKRFKVRGNTYIRAPRAAINLQSRCINFDIGDETIDTPLRYVTTVVTNGGSGYTSRPVVTVSGGGGSGMKVHAELTGGVVTALRVDDQGDGYTSAPTLNISGGGGTGATGMANISTGFGVMVQGTTSKGRIGPNDYTNTDQTNVIAVSLQPPSTGYGVAVSGESQFNGVFTELSGAINEVGGTYGTMSRMEADISFDATGGVNAITVQNGGSGYSSATVTISGGGGTGATATATIVNGVVTAIAITDPGSGYVSEPAIAITGDGSGASAFARAVGMIINAERGLLKAIRTGVGVGQIYPAYEDFTGSTTIFPDAIARSTAAQIANCTGTNATGGLNFTVRVANTTNVAVDSRFYCSLSGY
ncbi:hypothetical protein [Citrobacter braakii]|uniref:tail fiber/spike domain-containing protein n=1 Tax=Citrobacter braakii TaxID=57706 RepID=UPI00244A24C7|nr:hypothetical protein [Citrobacter braakii]MDH1756123.1 hypothetical protein [Citrobacter braakii]MDH1854462.1 hypothetical protein [Citrobacter braakii]